MVCSTLFIKQIKMRYDLRFLFNIMVIGSIIKYRKFILPSLSLLLLIVAEGYFLLMIINKNYETVSEDVFAYIMFIGLFVIKVGNIVYLIGLYKRRN